MNARRPTDRNKFVSLYWVPSRGGDGREVEGKPAAEEIFHWKPRERGGRGPSGEKREKAGVIHRRDY